MTAARLILVLVAAALLISPSVARPAAGTASREPQVAVRGVLLAGNAAGAETQGSPDLATLRRIKASISNWEEAATANNVTGKSLPLPQRWDDDQPCAGTWTGVHCDKQGRVSELILVCVEPSKLLQPALPVPQQPCFTGLLTNDYAALPALSKLDTYTSNLYGTLPAQWADAGVFSGLTFLRLSFNNASGAVPPEWGRPGAFPALKSLLLNNNNLSGELPPEWGNNGSFPSLELLFLGDNKFKGPLPASWGAAGAFPRLELLSVISNNLSGSLPPEWAAPGAFPDLQDLVLMANRFNGSLPSEWGRQGAWQNLTGPRQSILRITAS
ncbi:Leucine-rich repeat receptor-like protein kinase PXL1 [Tetrabaena socialis]|uniref:Leucine-rich repeat receptor-like protein kinase PXL1 n=1 Tax=Tetrabaena socialis TaxID=47790 RepID=A0A2J7ZXI9_9CHLO|nr:Leucine-rich repeat receptor-like protein kinase PXL1 [Tetrabaena socialis]|eukprot:PNH04990.1 Leucine-rich repeat receptor-like protein kinase PXL1 [Tetrabaena socialis]